MSFGVEGSSFVICLLFKVYMHSVNENVIYCYIYIFSLSFLGESGRPSRRSPRRGGQGEAQVPGSSTATFQQPKRERENFRKALVDIIMSVKNVLFLSVKNCCSFV